MMKNRKIFTNFFYIDPIGLEIRENMNMFIENGRIVLFSTNLSINDNTYENSCEVIDLKKSYVVPGLINSHCHLSGTGKPLPKFFEKPSITKLAVKFPFMRKSLIKTMKYNAYISLLHGITTLRSLGEPIYDVFNLQKVSNQLDNQNFIGSRIFTCGKALSLKDQQPGPTELEITSPEDAEEKAKFLIEQGADCIKVMATGSVTGAKTEFDYKKIELNELHLKKVCEIAHRYDTKVTAHCESTEGIKNCLNAGVDSIEHGAPFSEEFAKHMKENQIGYIPTLASCEAYDQPRKLTGLSKIEKINNDAVNEGTYQAIKDAIKHDLLIGAGTDAGIPLVFFKNFARELEMLHEAGLTPFQVIQAATINNAIIMGKQNDFGSLEEGKFADFIIFNPDHYPLDNLRQLSCPDAVYKNGIKYF